jgi:hypothetical protein
LQRTHPWQSRYSSLVLGSGWLLANPASAQAVDPGLRTVGIPGFMEPVAGANATERELLLNGINGFGQGGELILGTGPRLNALNCTNCHTFPTFGGASHPTSNTQESVFRVLQSQGARNVLPRLS